MWLQLHALAYNLGRVGKAGGGIKKIMIVALARKLLIALWRYAKDGAELRPPPAAVSTRSA